MQVTEQYTGQMLSGISATKQSIERILKTKLGSRTLFREFGSDIHSWIDKPSNDVHLHISHEIITSIESWLPDIQVERVEFEKSSLAKGIVDLKLTINQGGQISEIKF